MHIHTQKQTTNTHAESRHIVIDKELLFNNPNNVIEKYDEIMDLLQTNRSEGIAQLDLLCKKYDDEPMLASHLADCYSREGNENFANQMIRDNYRTFPLSVFTRCNYAHLCLREGHPVAAATAIEYTFDLAKLYPKRSRFHLLEVVEFQSLLVHYFCAIKDFDRAIASLSFLRTINKNLPIVDNLKTMIITSALQQTFSEQNIEDLFGSEEGENDDDDYEDEHQAEENSL